MQRGVEKARTALFKEINIPEIIMLHRYLKLVLIHLLPPDKLKEIKKQARSTIIDPDSDDNDKEEKSFKEDNKNGIDSTMIFQSHIVPALVHSSNNIDKVNQSEDSSNQDSRDPAIPNFIQARTRPKIKTKMMSKI